MGKIKSILKNGLDPYFEGKNNFEHPTPEIEELAKERAEQCSCLIDEPIIFLSVADPRIPELSNKMCKECGCTAAYKFRQSINKCDKWRR